MVNSVALIVATSVLVLIPGPNVALIVANSLRHGLKIGLVTALGTTCGLAFQLFLVVVGMAALIELAATALEWIRWLGVAYLVYLGIRAWIEPVANLQDIRAQSKSGYVANVDLQYGGERTDLSFRYDRRQLPSGSGNVSLANQARVRHTYAFTPRLSVTSEARWLKTKAIDSEQSGSDRKYRYFISGLTYRITPWWSLSGGYRYQWRVFDRDDGDSAESDMVFMSLSYNKALPLD